MAIIDDNSEKGTAVWEDAEVMGAEKIEISIGDLTLEMFPDPSGDSIHIYAPGARLKVTPYNGNSVKLRPYRVHLPKDNKEA